MTTYTFVHQGVEYAWFEPTTPGDGWHDVALSFPCSAAAQYKPTEDHVLRCRPYRRFVSVENFKAYLNGREYQWFREGVNAAALNEDWERCGEIIDELRYVPGYILWERSQREPDHVTISISGGDVSIERKKL